MPPRTIRGDLDGRGLRIAVLVAQWNGDVTSRLLDGALDVLRGAGVAEDHTTVVEVPGAFELPQAAAALAARRGSAGVGGPDAIIALGCLLRGETTHDRVLADACAKGLMDVAVAHRIPVTFGVITADTKAQAEARSDPAAAAGGKGGHKGREAAEAAIRLAWALRRAEGRS